MTTAPEPQPTEPQVPVQRREGRGRLMWPDDIESVFDRMMRGFGPWRSGRRGYFPLGREAGIRPDIDIFEQEGNLVIRADLPGMKQEDIEVTLEEDTLVIRGHRKSEEEVKEEEYHRLERATGSFARAINLPAGVDSEAIVANYKDGVLEVRVPKPATPEPRRLKVQVQ